MPIHTAENTETKAPIIEMISMPPEILPRSLSIVAHMASIQHKSAMGLITKMVKAGENSGYDPEMEIELSFEMFGTLRYCIFNEGNDNTQTGDQAVDATLTVGQSGLFISKTCSSDLVDWANSTFGTIYLGCIH